MMSSFYFKEILLQMSSKRCLRIKIKHFPSYRSKQLQRIFGKKHGGNLW